MRLVAESWEIVATLGDCQHIAKEAISWRAPGALKDTNFFFFFFAIVTNRGWEVSGWHDEEAKF